MWSRTSFKVSSAAIELAHTHTFSSVPFPPSSQLSSLSLPVRRGAERHDDDHDASGLHARWSTEVVRTLQQPRSIRAQAGARVHHGSERPAEAGEGQAAVCAITQRAVCSPQAREAAKQFACGGFLACSSGSGLIWLQWRLPGDQVVQHTAS